MRLDQERQAKLEPIRMYRAIEAIHELGIDLIYEDETEIRFIYKGHVIKFFPYSGWHQGKTVRPGRGLQNLLKQLS